MSKADGLFDTPQLKAELYRHDTALSDEDINDIVMHATHSPTSYHQLPDGLTIRRHFFGSFSLSYGSGLK